MDDELQAIRARRLAELQKQKTPTGGFSPGGFPGHGNDQGGTAEDAEKKRQMEEMREMMLAQILQTDARERLARIAMVKADKARSIEDMLIRMARMGQLRGKVNDTQLVDLLEQVNEKTKRNEPKIVFNRRRDEDDDDDDYGL
ncbi:hypothetical protein IWQ62_006177 [Dispira parvispora]|uniref:Programmed cell death protein 5 n=1 Tax=Dispira parvispora TaxID=1520584 RepID=A0A9W8APN9_9FUNG|nr:hypothetical protein IWQ62_006177 [Dispira parvispora]